MDTVLHSHMNLSDPSVPFEASHPSDGSDGSDGSDVSEVTEADWAQVEDDLRRLCTLQIDAARRMEALQNTLALQETGITPILQTCHEASLEELERTGEVTFGARVLKALQELNRI